MKILPDTMTRQRPMYLIDTNIISEMRKGELANAGVRRFFTNAAIQGDAVFLSVVTLGELRRGIDLLRWRGSLKKADRLERWFASILGQYADFLLDLDISTAQVWGSLRVPNPENALDKQLAATAVIHNLTLVTRNERHFENTGARVLNPFT